MRSMPSSETRQYEQARSCCLIDTIVLFSFYDGVYFLLDIEEL